MAAAAGTTYGTMSNRHSSGANAFAAGTVTVGLDPGGSQVTCSITAMNGGDSSAGAPIGTGADPTCKFQVKFTGSANAWLAVDVAVADGSTSLYDGSTGGLQLYLSDGTTTYLTSTATASGGGSGTRYTAKGGGATALPTTGVTDLLVNAASGGTAPGTIVHFALDYAVPAWSGSQYWGGSATITLTFHAVQAANNVPSGCTTGAQCPPSAGISWS